MEFIKFVGRAAVAGKQVAVYRDGADRVLRAETVGGNRVRVQYTDEQGGKQWKTLSDLRLDEERYESLMTGLEDGRTPGSPGGDGVVTRRALELLGLDFGDEGDTMHAPPSGQLTHCRAGSSGND